MTLSSTATRAQLLQRKAEINEQVRAARHKYQLPGATATDADVDHIDNLLSERDRIEVALEQRQTSPGQTRLVQVGQEERTYRADSAVTGAPSFFRDLALSQVYRDPSATERLARHQHEMTVDGRPGTRASVRSAPVLWSALCRRPIWRSSTPKWLVRVVRRGCLHPAPAACGGHDRQHLPHHHWHVCGGSGHPECGSQRNKR
jgi:hypothetical protein